MSTFNEEHRNMSKVHRENSRQAGKALFVGSGIAAVVLGGLIMTTSIAGIFPIALGAIALTYGFSYYK